MGVNECSTTDSEDVSQLMPPPRLPFSFTPLVFLPPPPPPPSPPPPYFLLQSFPVVIFPLLLMGRKLGPKLPLEHQPFSAVTLAMF